MCVQITFYAFGKTLVAQDMHLDNVINADVILYPFYNLSFVFLLIIVRKNIHSHALRKWQMDLITEKYQLSKDKTLKKVDITFENNDYDLFGMFWGICPISIWGGLNIFPYFNL